MPGLARRLLGKKTCLCSTARRDSFYEDFPDSFNKTADQQSIDQYGFLRFDKPKRLIRQTNMDESDGEDDLSIAEKLRRASSHSPANIPMLVVVSFNPDAKGLQKKQIEIHRGYPVNAQFIHNEWLFIKTADNEEGFVPYVCCRPMLRRQSLKHPNDIENFYKPYDFESNKTKSPSTSIPTMTPPTTKKFSFSSALGSQSFLFQNSFSCRKRQDINSSSCGGDSGFSDCESSSHNHHRYHHRSFDLPTQRYTRLSNIRSLRSSSNTNKKADLSLQDHSGRKPISTVNQMMISKLNGSSRIKSHLSISSNSAFTQFVKNNIKQNSQQDSNSHPSSHANTRLVYQTQQREVSSSSSSISNLRRPYDNYDEIQHLSSPSSKCASTGGVSSTVSSPYIRRTPFARRSLPHQPVLKKPLKPVSSSSPDPFKSIARQERQLRNVVLAEPSLPPAIIPIQSKIERHFSDLSLNQIENDSLVPSTSTTFVRHRPLFSCSSSSASATSSSTSSSSSNSSSSTDDGPRAFIHIQMNNSKCDLLHRGDSIPLVFPASTTSKSSSSFIHNVSITV